MSFWGNFLRSNSSLFYLGKMRKFPVNRGRTLYRISLLSFTSVNWRLRRILIIIMVMKGFSFKFWRVSLIMFHNGEPARQSGLSILRGNSLKLFASKGAKGELIIPSHPPVHPPTHPTPSRILSLGVYGRSSYTLSRKIRHTVEIYPGRDFRNWSRIHFSANTAQCLNNGRAFERCFCQLDSAETVVRLRQSLIHISGGNPITSSKPTLQNVHFKFDKSTSNMW